MIQQEVISLDANAYEVLSLAMRYVFTFIGVMIVWRAFSWLRKDRKQKHRRLRQLPDAGTIGILTVLQGSRELPPGTIISVPREGVLGYLRTCDIVIPAEDVAPSHADFHFVDGQGLYIAPWRHCEATVDGTPLRTRRDGLRCPMQHGSILTVGKAVLQLGVFAGLDVKEAHLIPEAFMPDDYDLPADDLPAADSPYQAPEQAYYPPQEPPEPWQGGAP